MLFLRYFSCLGAMMVAGAAVAAPTTILAPQGCAGGAVTVAFEYRTTPAGASAHDVLVDYGRGGPVRWTSPIYVESASDWQSVAVSKVTVPDGANVGAFILAPAGSGLEVKNLQVLNCLTR